ncbi:MAG: TSUP family transporter [Elusimicrobia bacterium]|nr:TSUP family transporter [Elusimicrobiota bacterium]
MQAVIGDPGFFVLALLVFLAGIVDSLAGGGGLITLPAYLAMGVPPGLVLGTNKLGSTIGTVASVARYSRSLKLAWEPFLPVVGAAVLGSYGGARLAVSLDPSYLRPLLLLALPAVAFAVFSDPGFGKADRSSRLSGRKLLVRSTGIAFVVGVYDGFFGPGTGTFFALGLTALCGYGLLEATTRAKILNLSTNVAALVAFLAAGRLDVRLGLAMGAASLAGHSVGAHLGVKKGAAVIRPVVLLVCAGLFVKLAFDAWTGR